MFDAVTEWGVTGRARETGVYGFVAWNPRDFAANAYRTVDDRPYGGGPGMVLKVEPLRSAVRHARERVPAGSPRVYLGADGERFETATARAALAWPGLVLVAGRYEGIDERVLERSIDLELSIGDYVLSGGELAALVVIDGVARLLPGALGDERSSVEESFAEGLLEGPQYTRPEVFDGLAVPPVLLSGDHAAIRRWRLKQALGRTAERRPDLLARLALDAERTALLAEYMNERTRR